MRRPGLQPRLSRPALGQTPACLREEPRARHWGSGCWSSHHPVDHPSRHCPRLHPPTHPKTAEEGWGIRQSVRLVAARRGLLQRLLEALRPTLRMRLSNQPVKEKEQVGAAQQPVRAEDQARKTQEVQHHRQGTRGESHPPVPAQDQLLGPCQDADVSTAAMELVRLLPHPLDPWRPLYE